MSVLVAGDWGIVGTVVGGGGAGYNVAVGLVVGGVGVNGSVVSWYGGVSA